MGKIIDAAIDIVDNRTIGHTPEDRKFIIARAKFVEEYCIKKGWPVDNSLLSFKQLMEICDQPGWINPIKKEAQ